MIKGVVVASVLVIIAVDLFAIIANGIQTQNQIAFVRCWMPGDCGGGYSTTTIKPTTTIASTTTVQTSTTTIASNTISQYPFCNSFKTYVTNYYSGSGFCSSGPGGFFAVRGVTGQSTSLQVWVYNQNQNSAVLFNGSLASPQCNEVGIINVAPGSGGGSGFVAPANSILNVFVLISNQITTACGNTIAYANLTYT